MSYKKRWISYIIVLCITVLLCLGLFIFTDLAWENIISLVGSTASVACIVLTLVEISSLRTVADATADAVKQNRYILDNLTNIHDISRHEQMICEAQSYIIAKKWELAHLRMREIHAMIKIIHTDPKIFGLERLEVTKSLTDISDDLRNLNKAITQKCQIEGHIIANHLDAIGPLFTQACHNIKQKDTSYESNT